jgi:hypothetical protein
MLSATSRYDDMSLTPGEYVEPDIPYSIVAPTHHLMRVRVRCRIFGKLREIARAESSQTGTHTSVSDLVRAALSDWIRTYESTTVLYSLQAGEDARKRPLD